MRHLQLFFASQCVLLGDLSGQAHSAPSPLPPGTRSTVCQKRAIPQLVDVTAKSGITFSHVAAPEQRYIVESMGGGVLAIDYDHDGWPDLYFTNAPTVAMALKGETAASALFHNNRDGTFTDVTAKAGVGHPCFAMGGAVGDYNNDGWPDMMVTNYVDFKLNDLPGFGKSPTCKFHGIDVQCGPRGLKGAGDTLFHNNGNGTFTNVSKATGTGDEPGYYGLGVVWSDFDNTGRPSLYIADDSTPNYLYRNQGGGAFTETGLESGTAVSGDGSEQGSMGVAIADYNHTGRFSIYVTNFADEFNTLYRNDGKGNFTDVSYDSGVALASLPYVKWGVAFVDLDNDGWADLFSVNGHVYPQVDTLPSGARYREPANLFMNERDGTFCDAAAQAGEAIRLPRVSRGLAAVDLDNDGNIDLVVENLVGAPLILHNNGQPGMHWVTFDLTGTKSNRLALGARVTLRAGGITQTDEVRSGGSYLSQGDLRVHFGLGSAATIDSVEVRWPSGRVEALGHVAVDRIYQVQEGSGVASPAAAVRPVR